MIRHQYHTARSRGQAMRSVLRLTTAAMLVTSCKDLLSLSVTLTLHGPATPSPLTDRLRALVSM